MKKPPEYPPIESAREFRDFVETSLPAAALIGERAIQTLNLDDGPLWNVRTSVAGTYLWYTKTGPVVYTVPNYNELALELPDLPLVGQAPHLGLRGNATDIIPLRFTWGIGKSKIFVDEPTEGKVSVEPQRVAHLLIDLGAFTVTSIAKGRSV